MEQNCGMFGVRSILLITDNLKWFSYTYVSRAPIFSTITNDTMSFVTSFAEV